MTPSEAIQHIKRHIEVHRIKEPQAIYITEALKMAVEALDLVKDLKEWESRSKDIIELQDIEKESLMIENEKLKAFKSYFDSLYGTGLEIANWHLNGDLESFDGFHEAALEEMERII